MEEVVKPATVKTVGFSEEPKEMTEIEPRPEDDSSPKVDNAKGTKDSSSSSSGSELGDAEAFDEEEDGMMDDDD